MPFLTSLVFTKMESLRILSLMRSSHLNWSFKSNSLPLGKLSGRHAFVEKLRELALDYTEEDIKPLFAKFKALADKKQEITDADIRALVAGTMVENPEGFHFDDLQLQTHADNDIEALVSLANMDGEKSNLMRQDKVPLKRSLTLSISSLTNLSAWCPIPSMR